MILLISLLPLETGSSRALAPDHTPALALACEPARTLDLGPDSGTDQQKRIWRWTRSRPVHRDPVPL